VRDGDRFDAREAATGRIVGPFAGDPRATIDGATKPMEPGMSEDLGPQSEKPSDAFAEWARVQTELSADRYAHAAALHVAVLELLRAEELRTPGFCAEAKKRFDTALGLMGEPSSPEVPIRARKLFMDWMDGTERTMQFVRRSTDAEHRRGPLERLWRRLRGP
jgi:hypothetical protein